MAFGPRLVVLSGCSGGGKSTLLATIAARGVATVAEPGRRVIAAERATGGGALPWLDMAGFAQAALAMAITDHAAASVSAAGLVVFDRGAVDAAVALAHAGPATGDSLAALVDRCRYDPCVYLCPPWPELFVADGERRHGFDDAVAEYDRLARAYPALGYRTMTVPKLPVTERASWLMATMTAGVSGPA